MPWSKIASVLAATAMLGALGCGSSKKASSTSSATSPSGAASPYAPPSTSTTAASALTRSRTYRVKLAGSNEVPAGAPSGSGIAVVTLRAKTNQACWSFSALKEVTSPTASHIHEGGAGTSGPVVIAFAPPYRASGCVAAPPALLARIAAAPHQFYVNIHNAKYPGGVVRAQL